ncbi:hypothetical protein P255_01346 [Acinetobacter brisouii CIP 110357]|uniref:Uncharacterized protein n=1 Tax=Acinetobacter brisouii CIP 110357 TaxID=1341683 RepID=V2U8Y0_9GAMM|nr:hypothetical protein [Acinetobacter brisouii]ENV46127.1 hypothetical protein F954_02954 [Acinetobacter brisouii ANC 4119]ESK50848.1 hypothetical protein P255_01346 [Acinetobacter brisouii CIP 110357]
MKNEIMSKSEVNSFVCIFLGLVGYSIFMFYLLVKRSKGINYFDDLSSVNRFIVYSSVALEFICLKIVKNILKIII